MPTRTRSSPLATRLVSAACITTLCSAALAQNIFVRPVDGLTGAFSTAIAHVPGDDRIIAIDRVGLVRIARPGDPPLAQPVLDFTSLVPNDGDENGALGLALDPQFATNGFLYIFHSRINAGPVVVRYTVNRSSPNWTIDPASRFTVIQLPSFSAIHISGWIGFGPDGLLYISHGDNGAAGNAQNMGTTRGKILRIDVNNDDFPADDTKNYAIPELNPFATGTISQAPEIWLAGVRNAYRCSFDALTGDFYAADVGDSSREEITRVAPGVWQNAGGVNLGWPCFEGTLERQTTGCDYSALAYQAPLDDFLRSELICVIGGYVYRGCGIPALEGRYLFSNCATFNQVLSLDPANPSTFIRHTITGAAIGQALAWGEDPSGELFILAGGGVYKVVGLGDLAPDCDGDGVADRCDLQNGLATDLNNDGVPDRCTSICPADFNGASGVSVQDVFDFLATWFENIPAADFNADGAVSVQDIFDFLAAWFTGC